MFILGLIIGFVAGIVSVIFAHKWVKIKSKNDSIVYSRRGLYYQDYNISQGGVPGGTLSVTFEVGEIDYSDTKSKIEVISIKTNRSEYNKSSDDLERVTKMADQSWVDSKEIEWIQSASKSRNDKIDKILA